jgi:hypothetical protein
MVDRNSKSDEKREHQRSSICKKIKFSVGSVVYSGLIGDASNGGLSIISKHKLIQGSVINLKIPPMSGTVQYCVPHGKGFFRAGLRLLQNHDR